MSMNIKPMAAKTAMGALAAVLLLSACSSPPDSGAKSETTREYKAAPERRADRLDVDGAMRVMGRNADESGGVESPEELLDESGSSYLRWV